MQILMVMALLVLQMWELAAVVVGTVVAVVLVMRTRAVGVRWRDGALEIVMVTSDPPRLAADIP